MRQEVKSAAAAASLTHTHQAVHVHSSWPGLNESICTVMIYIINTRQTKKKQFTIQTSEFYSIIFIFNISNSKPNLSNIVK